MRPESKKRIDTNPAQAPLAGMDGAFSNLNLPELPENQITPSVAKDSPQLIWKMGRVVLRRETAHRGGKTVIVIHDFAPSVPLRQIEELARKLRNACGCWGTIRERAIELQGDQPAKIRSLLEDEGFK